jgi:xylulokinase
MVATGEYLSVREACGAIVRERDIVEPRSEEAKIYADGHAVYRSLYPALKPLFSHFRALGSPVGGGA